jgi:hypothetical protein
MFEDPLCSPLASMAWTLHVRADACARPRGRECFIPGNFNKNATVHPSHGRPRGHRPTVRTSVRYRPRDNPGCPYSDQFIMTMIITLSCFRLYKQTVLLPS